MEIERKYILEGLIYQFKQSDEVFFEQWKELIKKYKGINTEKKNHNEVGICNLMWVCGLKDDDLIKELKTIRTTDKVDKYFFSTKEERYKALISIYEKL